jgi:hypothetical protein
VTKKYLQQIEKAYQKSDGRAESPDYSKSPDPANKEVYEKYKAMRDTAIDIGKWINNGYTKKEDKAVVTKYNTPFMEQRLARISNNGGRNPSNGKGSPSLYAKTSPPESTNTD